MRLLDALDRIAGAMLTLCAGITVCTVFWALFFQKPFLSYENSPFPVMQATLRPGDAIPLVIERCSSDKIDRSYAISRALREVSTGAIIPMEPLYSLILPGCDKRISDIHVVPASVPPGRYVVYGGAIIYGAVRTFNVIFQSQQFDVVAAKK